MFSFLTPELIIGLTGLVTAVAKIFGDKREKKKHSWEDLGRAAWLVFIGDGKPLGTREAAISQWRRIAENLALTWGIKINAKSWAVLEKQARNRYELASRRQWDAAMAALLEQASGVEKWANGIAPEVLRLPKRLDTIPGFDE